MKELKRFRLPHSTQLQEEDGSKTRILSFNKKKSQSTKIRFTVQIENLKRQSELVFERFQVLFFFLVKASLAKGRRRLQKNTDFLVLLCLPASFLTFGKVNPGPPESAFVLAPASFLTFGKVNPAPLRLTFFLGGVPPPPTTTPPDFCQRRAPPSH